MNKTLGEINNQLEKVTVKLNSIIYLVLKLTNWIEFDGKLLLQYLATSQINTARSDRNETQGQWENLFRIIELE